MKKALQHEYYREPLSTMVLESPCRSQMHLYESASPHFQRLPLLLPLSDGYIPHRAQQGYRAGAMSWTLVGMLQAPTRQLAEASFPASSRIRTDHEAKTNAASSGG